MFDDVEPSPLPRRLPAPGPRLDGAVVAALFATDLVGQVLASAGRDVASAELAIGPLAVAAVSAAAMWWRRTRPLLVLGAAVVLLAISAGAAEPGLLTHNSGATIVLATYAAGSWSPRRRWSAAAAVLLLVLAIAGALGDGTGVAESVTIGLAIVALPWVLGHAARTQRRYVAEVEQRLAAAERERDERARRAVADERAHIARELHDVVAHHVSLIGVQAGAARTSLDRSPEATRAALREIEASSRAAVGEMRHVLDALRGTQPAALAPQPGLADLGRLAAGFTRAGIDVDMRCEGAATGLSPLLELCCYRIVEEALTNVTRHSTAQRATVDVERRPAAVWLAVVDPGPRRPGSDGSGRGLIGMSERVALFGGTLTAGQRDDGGFSVVAEVPLNGGAG